MPRTPDRDGERHDPSIRNDGSRDAEYVEAALGNNATVRNIVPLLLAIVAVLAFLPGPHALTDQKHATESLRESIRGSFHDADCFRTVVPLILGVVNEFNVCWDRGLEGERWPSRPGLEGSLRTVENLRELKNRCV